MFLYYYFIILLILTILTRMSKIHDIGVNRSNDTINCRYIVKHS